MGIRIILIAGLLMMSCATTKSPAEAELQPASFEDQVKQAAVVAAANPQLVLRYNPVKCSCPAFEVQVGSRWVRVKLEDVKTKASPAATLTKRASDDLKAGKIAHYKVKGELDSSLRRCAKRAIYLSLSIESTD